MEKSYVTLERCLICKGDTGSILMDKRLRNKFDMHTTLPTSVCDKCRKKYLNKGVMLVNPETGTMAVIKNSAFKRIFDKPIPKGKIAFAEEKVLEMIMGGQNG